MDHDLSKKERIRLKHEFEKAKVEQGDKTKRLFIWAGGIVVLISVGILSWFFLQKSTEPEKPKPGKEVADLGQQHVADTSGVKYNSNPPTSGHHFDVWAKKGVYSDVIADGHLIHSLEHGYVVLSYNCASKEESEAFASSSAGLFDVTKLKADSKMSAFTPSNPPPQEIALPESFQTETCKKLVEQLSVFIEEFDRIIIVPRPQMESKIAVTAWNIIDMMNSFDEERVRSFIAAFHNAGPEKTAE